MAISIPQPADKVFKKSDRYSTVMAKLRWGSSFGSDKSEAFSLAQAFVDSECLRYMNPMTPRLTGYLIKSGTYGTAIGSGEIVCNAPYARRQYYENHGNGLRGRLWFERMKSQNKDAILKGAGEIAGR